ncbi:MAG: SseB family protein [bacterium]
MSVETVDPCIEILERTSKGKATFIEFASALKSLKKMITLVPPANVAQFVHSIDEVQKEKSTPSIYGITIQDGTFVPYIFTNDTIAREYAKSSGMSKPETGISFVSNDWISGLWEFLMSGFAGVVIDKGSEHTINLDRKSLATLYAYISLEEFARLSHLCVVTYQGRTHYQRPPNGAIQAFVYDDEKAASECIENIRQQFPGAAVLRTATPQLLNELLKAGITLLVVNHGLADMRLYNRDDIITMANIVGIRVHPSQMSQSQPTATPAAGLHKESQSQSSSHITGHNPDMTASGEEELPKPLAMALKHPMRPMFPCPEHSDAEAQMLFQGLKMKVDQRSIDMWEILETLSFKIKFYMFIHPRPVDGLCWTQFFRSADDENKTITYLYTSEALIHNALKGSPPEYNRFRTISGIEALRWIWAAPTNIDLVGIDYYAQSPAHMRFPSFWALSSIYPLFYDIPDIQQIPHTEIAHAGSIPGARGLKPEVIRALLAGWKQLIGIEPTDENIPLISYQEKHYLPVFSSIDQLCAFSSSPHGIKGKPKPTTGSIAPFRRWLELTADSDGVILDPAAHHPLILDHTDLCVLDLWSQRSGSSPKGDEIISSVASLYNNNRISSTCAARIVADYPRYWVGFDQSADKNVSILMVPNTDACALFTSSQLLQDYLAYQKGKSDNTRKHLETMSPTPILTNWNNSALALAAEQFLEIWINPHPTGDGGIHLKMDAINAGLARIDEKCKPRVPGFIWEV